MARRQLRDDVGGREKGDLDIVEAGQASAIIAGAAALDDIEPGARKKSPRRFPAAALSRGRQAREKRAWPPVMASPTRTQAIDPDRRADGGNLDLGAKRLREAVVAAAADGGLAAPPGA